MRESKIKYDPKLSIHENAVKNNVSEDGIWYYVKTRKIDRRYERKVNLVNEIRTYLKAHPDATRNEVATALKHGINTIREYWDIAKGKKVLQSDIGSSKKPRIDIRELNDFYATHPSATRDILREESFGKYILEPFCGSGTMAEVIKQSGREVKASDIIDRGYGETCDFFNLEVEEGKFDIITNPPYYNNSFTEIIKKCLNIAKSKVAILLPLRYLSSRVRYTEIYKEQPPSRVYVYQERICIAKNADFEKYNDAGANLEIYAWFVWDKDYQGETILRWISNEKATL